MTTLAAVVVAGITSFAQPSMRPGLYEFTVEIGGTIPGEAGKAVLDAAGLNKQVNRECVTPEAVKGSLAEVFAREMVEDGNCKMSNVKTTGNKVTFTTTCDEDGERMVGTNEFTINGDNISGQARMTGADMTVTMRITGKRIGACPQ